LHRFFESLGVPYRAFEADNPEAIRTAVETINRLETSPALYVEQTPRRDYSNHAYALALCALSVLLAARLAERSIGRPTEAMRAAKEAASS
jgi:mxaC protein